MKNEDTIAAISTAMNPGGISIIRVSGKNAVDIADKICCADKSGCRKKSLAAQPANSIRHSYIVADGKMIDEVLVSVFRAPKSYTGEDTVEINAHGGILVTRKILESLLHAGARLAEPGEFTKRAFLNGRMDLAEAEAVMDVISASNEYALKSSVEQLKGSLSEKIRKLRNRLLDDTAYIEAALDDPEHISLDGFTEKLEDDLFAMSEEIGQLIRSFQQGRIVREGIRTVILGKPNAGKSSVLNVLSGYERAIVTEIAGTTRDVLEESISLNGMTLLLMDTAGIRDSADPVEKIGIQKARNAAENADLILYVIDASLLPDPEDLANIRQLEEKKTIIVLNKSDLDTQISEENIRKSGINLPVVVISAREEKGIDDLSNCIQQLLFEGNLSFNDQVVITNVRHKDCLEKAREALGLVLQGIEEGMPEDLLTIDLMNAYSELGVILGEDVGDDLADRIFEKFCMGK